MRIRQMDWRHLCDEVRYWDATDLLSNFQEEMENVRTGLIHWMLKPCSSFPIAPESVCDMMLPPEVSESEGGVEFIFPGMEKVERDDIWIEIMDDELILKISKKVDEGEVAHHYSRLSIPDDLNRETCEATISQGKLKISFERRKTFKKRQVPIK